MQGWEYVLGVILILVSLAIIVIVLMQQSKADGLSGAITGGAAETFFGKHKGRTIEAKLAKVTKFLAGVFIILALGTTVLVGFFG